MLAVAAGFEGILDLARGDALRPTFIRPQEGLTLLWVAPASGRDVVNVVATSTKSVTGFCYVEHMSTPLRGLRTLIYPASDLAAAKAWWTDYLGFPPTSMSRSTSASKSRLRLGLVPTDQTGASPTTYWGVDDVAQAVETLRPTVRYSSRRPKTWAMASSSPRSRTRVDMWWG